MFVVKTKRKQDIEHHPQHRSEVEIILTSGIDLRMNDERLM